MKKLFLFILLLLISISHNAQTYDGSGIKVGYGITNQSWIYTEYDALIDWDYNTGIIIKAFTDFTLSSNFQLEGEAGYTQKGTKYSLPVTTEQQPNGSGEYLTLNNKLNYLSVSLLGKLKFDVKAFTPYILLGPEYNYLINRTTSNLVEVVYSKYKKSNLGYSVGAGTEIKITSFRFLLEYRFSRDLTSNYSSVINIKNYSHTFTFGVKI